MDCVIRGNTLEEEEEEQASLGGGHVGFWKRFGDSRSTVRAEDARPRAVLRNTSNRAWDARFPLCSLVTDPTRRSLVTS